MQNNNFTSTKPNKNSSNNNNNSNPIVLSSTRNTMPFPAAIESVRSALQKYQQINVLNPSEEKNNELVKAEQALRQAQLGLDRALIVWIDVAEKEVKSEGTETVPPGKQEVETVKEDNYALLFNGLQLRVAVEIELRTVLPWASSTSDTERLQKLNPWCQRVEDLFNKYVNEKKLDVSKVTLFYNLRILLEDALRPNSYWNRIKRSIKTGEFREIIKKLYPSFDPERLPLYLSEMTTSQLAIRFNDMKTPTWQRDHIKTLVLGINTYFREKTRSSELIAAVLPLGACSSDEIRLPLLESFIQPIRDNVLLDPMLLHGLAQLIRYVFAVEKAPENQKTSPGKKEKTPRGSDDLWQILGVLFDRLAKLHIQPGDTEKLQKLLYAMGAVLNAMVDQGVTGIPETTALGYSQQLRGLDTYKNPDIEFQIAYTQQALARVPDDTPMFKKYFGCAVRITGSLVTIVKGAVAMDPGSVLSGLMSLKETVSDTARKVARDWKSEWYKILRVAELYLHPNPTTLRQLRKLFGVDAFQSHQHLEYGILMNLTPMALNSPSPIQTQTLRLIYHMTVPPQKKQKQKEEKSTSTLSPAAAMSAVKSVVNKQKKLVTSNTVFSFDIKVQNKALEIVGAINTKEKKDSYDWLEIVIRSLQAVTKQKQENNKLKQLKKFPLFAGFLNPEIALAPKLPSPKDLAERNAAVNRELDTVHKMVLEVYRQELPLEYRIEDLKRQIEESFLSSELASDLRHYIPLQGVERLEDLQQLTKIMQSNTEAEDIKNFVLFDLEKRIEAILAMDGSQLTLIQGRFGKALFGRHIQQILWKRYEPGQPIPLFISLSLLKDPTTRCVEQALENFGWRGEDIELLKSAIRRGKAKLLVILDGFDEIRVEKNLYKTNELNQWQAKVIITSPLQTGDYQALFRTDDPKIFHEYFITPFSYEQALTYLTSLQEAKQPPFLSPETKKANAIQEAKQLYGEFLAVAGLAELLKESPYILKVLTEVWDFLKKLKDKKLKEEGKIQPITRTLIYQTLVNFHYEQASERLRLQQQVSVSKGFLLTPSFQALGEELAVKMLKYGNMIVPIATNQYHKQEAAEQDPWVRFFDPAEKERQIALRGVPLKYTEYTLQFQHKSILEYYAACALFKSINPQRTTSLSETDDFNQFRLDLEPGIMGFLQEMIEYDAERIEVLFVMIANSADQPKCTRMAANAASLLAFMGVSFRNRQLQNVRICQADLTGANLDHVNLSGADLTGVKLPDAWLSRACLDGANLNEVDFGVWPYLKHKDKEGVKQIAYVASGNCLVTASENDLYIWDVTTSQLKMTLQGHTKEVTCVSVSADGTTIVSGSKDLTVRLWDAETGKPLGELARYEREITYVKFNLSGNIIASGGKDGVVDLWNRESKKLLHSIAGHKEWITAIAFSPDSSKVATAALNDKNIRVWDVATGKLVYELIGHKHTINGIDFNSDGSLLASAGHDKTVGIWDTKKRSLQRSITLPDKNWILCVAFSPDGKKVAAGTWENLIHVCNVETGACQRTFTGHTLPVQTIAYNKEGNVLASAGLDGAVRLWDVETVQFQRTSLGHTSGVRKVTYSPDGRQAASCGLDKTIRVWDAQSGILQFVCTEHTADVRDLAFSPNKPLLASVSNDKTIRLWDANNGKLLQTIPGGSTTDIVTVAFSLDGNTLIAGYWDKAIRGFNVSNGELSFTLNGHGNGVFSVMVSPDGNTLASASQDQTVLLWNMKTREVIYKLSGHKGSVRGVAFSPDGAYVASGGYDKTVRLWDVKTGKLQKTFSAEENVESVVFSPDGTLVVGGAKNSVKIWDINTGENVYVLKGYLSPVNSVAWHSKAGLLTGSQDRSVKCWYLVELGKTDKTVVWQLVWNTHMNFMMEGCQMNSVQLSLRNAQLLRQRGAQGEPLLPKEVKVESQEENKKKPWQKDIKPTKLSSYNLSLISLPGKKPEGLSEKPLTQPVANTPQTQIKLN